MQNLYPLILKQIVIVLLSLRLKHFYILLELIFQQRHLLEILLFLQVKYQLQYLH